MLTIVNTRQADPLDNASTREEIIQAAGVARNAADRIHHYVILHRADGETHENLFIGTPAERVDHMEAEVIVRDGEEINPLGLNLETDAWASGWFDWSTLRWQACGPDAELIAEIKQRPRPTS